MKPPDVALAYRDLPIEPAGLPNAWGVWDRADDRGTINRITHDVVAAAAASVRTGQTISLSLPLDQPGVALGERAAYRRTHLGFDFGPDHYQDDLLDSLFLQASTHWDGLRHLRGATAYYNGVDDAAAGPDGNRLGVDAWARSGIVGRGLLVDVEAHLAARGAPISAFEAYAIEPALIDEILTGIDESVQPGDILLVRTGFLTSFLDLSVTERGQRLRDLACPGLAPTEEMAAYLWDRGVSAIAVDNPGVEMFPVKPAATLHQRLIPMLGFALGEFFTLDELAACCRSDGRYSCFFLSVPLRLPGGVGSPANALAIR